MDSNFIHIFEIMKNIENKEDVKFLVESFYRKVLKDETIGFIFTKVAKIDLEKHLPRLYGFWNSVLLGTNEYMGNTMGVHWTLHEKNALTDEHFDKWMELWTDTVNENFEGEKAEEAINRAKNILELMRFKLIHEEE